MVHLLGMSYCLARSELEQKRRQQGSSKANPAQQEAQADSRMTVWNWPRLHKDCHRIQSPSEVAHMSCEGSRRKSVRFLFEGRTENQL